MVEALQAKSPEARDILKAELSLAPSSEHVRYGSKGSTRLDILEDRTADLGAVCVFDIKTGTTGLTTSRVDHIADLVRKHFGQQAFFIIEVRPSR
jgi:hypothetical protein